MYRTFPGLCVHLPPLQVHIHTRFYTQHAQENTLSLVVDHLAGNEDALVQLRTFVKDQISIWTMWKILCIRMIPEVLLLAFVGFNQCTLIAGVLMVVITSVVLIVSPHVPMQVSFVGFCSHAQSAGCVAWAPPPSPQCELVRPRGSAVMAHGTLPGGYGYGYEGVLTLLTLILSPRVASPGSGGCGGLPQPLSQETGETGTIQGAPPNTHTIVPCDPPWDGRGAGGCFPQRGVCTADILLNNF